MLVQCDRCNKDILTECDVHVVTPTNNYSVNCGCLFQNKIDNLKEREKMLRECVEFVSNQVHPYLLHEHIDDLETRFGKCIEKSKKTLNKSGAMSE